VHVLIGLLALLVWLGTMPGPARAETATPSATASLAPPVPLASASLEQLLSPPEPVVPRPRTLTLLHVNDTFGCFLPIRVDPYTSQERETGGAVRLAAMVARERAAGGPTLFLCAGNALGPRPHAAIHRGRDVVAFMNRLGVDAWLPCGYDFSYGVDTLLDRISEASASAVLTNVRWSGNGLPIARPYATFERGGVKVAVLGLVDPAGVGLVNFADRARIAFDPPLEAAERWVPIIRHQASPDVIVALTHLTLDQEMPLLSRHSGIDLVVGGFVSTNPSAIAIHQVIGSETKRALHAGAFGTALGKARLTLEPNPQGVYRLARLEPDWLRLDDETLPLKQAIRGAPAIASDLSALIARDAAEWTRDHGDLANLSNHLAPGGARRVVAEIMRLRAHAEVAVVPRSFFHDEEVYGPVSSAKSLYYALPWEDALSVVNVPGDRLETLFNRLESLPGSGLFAGLERLDGTLRVNDRPLDPKAHYSVAVPYPATLGLHLGFEALTGMKATLFTVSVRRAVVQYLQEQARLGRAVSSQDFPDYSQIPFWKSNLQLTTDMSRNAVDTAGGKYPDLTWNSDKSGMSWGGDVVYQLGTAWGTNELDDSLELAYHSDQLATGQSQTTTDKIQFIGDYRSRLWSQLVKPFATLTLTTRFINDPASPPFFLGQITTGFSHQLPIGLELREGAEYRHHLFDRTQPDKTGGTMEVIVRQALGWFKLSTDLKLFATPHLSADGLLIDDQTIVSLPLTDVTSLTYQLDLYRNTLFPDWANRHLMGLTIKLAQPWLY
jgi:hypothetical protein